MRVAVVTRTLNRPHMLKRAADSVLAQSYDNLVWSVINDGGERGPVEEQVQLVSNNGVETKLSHHNDPQGRAAAANTGVRQVSCDAVLLLDDDDRLHPDAVSLLVETLQRNPSNDIGVVGQVEVVQQSVKKGDWVEESRTVANPQPGPIRLIDLAYRNIVPVNGFLYRREIFDRLGGYDEGLPVVEDWDFVLRAILIGDIGKLQKPVAEYFIREATEDKDDPTGNSVTSGHHLHEEWEARLRNKYLRADLEAGVAGLGHLLNPHYRLPMERINRTADLINSASKKNAAVRFIARLFGRP